MTFVFRSSKVKGGKYLQIWEKVEKGTYEYAGTIGSAANAKSLLVKLSMLQELTNEYDIKLTNALAENKILLTKIKDLTK